MDENAFPSSNNVDKDSATEIIRYSKPFATTPEYAKKGDTKTAENNKTAYIMSSGEEFSPTGEKYGFKEGNHEGTISDKADEQLIQDALWRTAFNEGNPYDYEGKNKEILDLENEGLEYEKFYKNYVRGGYENKVKVSNKKSQKNDDEGYQVIVNRNDNDSSQTTYLVGPFKIEYPDKLKFSYIEDIHIQTKDNTNIDLLYSKQKFDIITESNKTKYPNYPKSNEKFWVKFKAGDAGDPTSIKIKVDFAYLAGCSAQYDRYEGKGKVQQVKITAYEKEFKNACTNHYTTTKVISYDEKGNKVERDIRLQAYQNKYQWYMKSEIVDVGTYKAQILVKLIERQRTWKRYEKYLTSEDIDLTIELGGKVWEDHKEKKETLGNHINDTQDKPMPGVEVTLYDKNGNKVKLANNCKNPTYTDSKGEYKFTGIKANNQYYVKFKYNSQYYQPVNYVSPQDKNNGWGKENWIDNSNGTDINFDRNTINARFASIGSSPENYTRPNGENNKTYSKQVLLGKKLQSNGSFKEKEDYQIIDDFGNLLHNADGKLIVKDKTGKECIITEQNGNYLINGNLNTEINRKIKFVLDCQLDSYTKDNNKDSFDLYPVDKKFVEDKHLSNLNTKVLDGTEFANPKILYEENAPIYHINQGYVTRESVELALYKDVARVYTTINGKENSYKYESRSKEAKRNPDSKNIEEGDIDIKLRLADVYYNTEYYRELQPADYAYKKDLYGDKPESDYGKNEDSELKVYVKYKFTVYNNSPLIRTRIDEIVDYYDKDLIFDSNDGYIKANTYAVRMSTRERKNLGEGFEIILDNEEKQQDKSYTNTTGYYNQLYFKINNENPYLSTGDYITYYITFRVNKDGNRNILLDDNEGATGKENFAEINGYSTKYYDNVKVPNRTDVSRDTNAGIIDIYSNPGNLTLNDMKEARKGNYANFESDTDKAPNIFLRLRNDENSRIIRGTVWEDKRTKDSTGKSRVGDGILNEENSEINGVTVQLVEVMNNGSEFVWQTVSSGQGTYKEKNYKNTDNTTKDIFETGFIPIINFTINNKNMVKDVSKKGNGNENGFENGEYVFKSFPAGNYVIRFIYGDTVKTVLPNSNEVTNEISKTGLNSKSYSGQDYKSTSYQINSNEKNKYTAVNSGDYDYKIEDIESLEKIKIKGTNKDSRMSDAKDLKIRRDDVNKYSNNNDDSVKNALAEILSSNELLQSYDKNKVDKITNKLDTLMNNTAMTAETGKINVEIERTSEYTGVKTEENNGKIVTTEQNGKYDGNSENKIGDTCSYKLLNIDFGLEERPKAQLVVDKEVENVKLTLADGTTLFDAEQKATNVLWQDHKKYNVNTNNNLISIIENIRTENATSIGLIQMSMDEELMHGATIKITYKITVRNEGEVDFANEEFYYTGNISGENINPADCIVKTRANTLVDYVANNLKFMAEDNPNWETIELDNLVKTTEDSLVNSNLKEEIEKYNTIITTRSNSGISKTELVPNLFGSGVSEVSDKLVLTQSLATENSSDDLTYRNIVEIVSTNNTVGRRMAFSVVGNQNPNTEPQEIDSDKAEVVKILPPFGESSIYILITATIIASIGLLIGGIIFIKKKVLI